MFFYSFHYCHSVHYHLYIFSHFRVQMCDVPSTTTAEELKNIEVEET